VSVKAFVFPDKRMFIIPTANVDKARKLFPHARVGRVDTPTGPRYLVAVPHVDEYVRIARGAGVDVPGGIRYYYDWSGAFTPRRVQELTAEFLTLNRRAFCLNAMGTGKTISSLWAYDYLRQGGKVNRMLVVCPLSTMTMTWANEVFRHFPHLQAAVLHGERRKRLQLLEQEADVYIVNHDGLPIIADALADRDDINLIVYDEVAVCRNASTRRWKVANQVINRHPPPPPGGGGGGGAPPPPPPPPPPH